MMSNYSDELFEKRDAIAALIEKQMLKKGINKSSLCKKTSISRPTLDKLLKGEITNKKNFDKHIDKIFQVLEIQPDSILKNNVKIRSIRSRLNISQQHISEATHIPMERLAEIEAGDKASLSEYRDIAACLGTSIRVLKSESVFESNTLGISSMFRDEENEFSSFWGHIGIQPMHKDKHFWFPISNKTRSDVFSNMDKQYVLIPCMNNNAILINSQSIKHICLLDEACDSPDNIDWDFNVSEGEIPPVVYESLEDYLYGFHENMSDTFLNYMEQIVRENGWSTDKLHELQETRFYFTDGTELTDIIELGEYENISDFIYNLLYFSDIDDLLPATLYCSNVDGAESIIPLNTVSMITIPLTDLEKSVLGIMDKE